MNGADYSTSRYRLRQAANSSSILSVPHRPRGQFPIRSNVSHEPTPVRLAINHDAPPFSAHTIKLLACARRAMLPLPRSISSNCSHDPIAVRLAIKADAPAFSAVTTIPLACARRLITDGPMLAAFHQLTLSPPVRYWICT